MSIFNPVARALWAGGGDSGEIRRELEKVKQDYNELELFAHPFEKITENGTDALGDFVFVEQDYTPNPNSKSGYFRLRPNVRDMVNMQVFYGESYDLTEWTQATRRMKNDGSYAAFSVANGAARVIFPEVYPNSWSSDGTVNVNAIPNVASVPPVSVYLPKHTANNASSSNWISGTVPSAVKEHIVVAPKDMDAPLHLHRFTLMSVDTIVAILENLADVSDRANPPTLTLGATNLAKLTEEQIAIAEQKGWNLA